jgi:hypothetical protein
VCVATGLGFFVSGSAAGASARHGCSSGDVKLSLGREVVPMTGEHADLFELTNVSNRACVLDGYPRVSLSSQGKRLPFVYADGGGLYVTKRRPQRVTLGPGGHGYFLVAKYRCDVGVRDTATSIRVVLPGSTGAFTLDLSGRSAAGLDYCRRSPGPQRVDPGNRVVASPIEATAMDAESLQ